MFVSKPIINDGIKKFVSYTLGGSAIGQEVSRRFSDFYSLREKLIERWPGVYIPNVPPKKAVGNTDSKIIDKRIRLLNRFCYQLSTINFLFESEEVKLFQSNGNEIAKAISALSKPNYQEILEKYNDINPEIVPLLLKMLENNPEKIVLGCTHYPFLTDVLSEYAPADLFLHPVQ